MYARILVATDLTPATRPSLRAAFDLARRDQGEILLLHVIRRINGIPDRELRDFYERLRADAKLKMFALTRAFNQEHGTEIACQITIGPPAREIVRQAGQYHADLIVLAHAPLGCESPFGSVSYRVAHLAPCDVLLLKGAVSAPALRRPRATRPAERTPAKPRRRAPRA